MITLHEWNAANNIIEITLSLYPLPSYDILSLVSNVYCIDQYTFVYNIRYIEISNLISETNNDIRFIWAPGTSLYCRR